jgi:hypothetical protein
MEPWDIGTARDRLREVLERMSGCAVEVIM